MRVAEAMAVLGRDDAVLEWTARGIEQAGGWQTAKLYGLACTVYAKRAQPVEALRLRRTQAERMPSLSTYTALRGAANEVGAWEVERDAARAALRARDLGALVDALLNDGDAELAWQMAAADPSWDPGSDRWLRVVDACEAQHPADSLGVYLRVVDEVLQTSGPARVCKCGGGSSNGREQRQRRRISFPYFSNARPGSANNPAADPP